MVLRILPYFWLIFDRHILLVVHFYRLSLMFIWYIFWDYYSSFDFIWFFKTFPPPSPVHPPHWILLFQGESTSFQRWLVFRGVAGFSGSGWFSSRRLVFGGVAGFSGSGWIFGEWISFQVRELVRVRGRAGQSQGVSLDFRRNKLLG